MLGVDISLFVPDRGSPAGRNGLGWRNNSAAAWIELGSEGRVDRLADENATLMCSVLLATELVSSRGLERGLSTGNGIVDCVATAVNTLVSWQAGKVGGTGFGWRFP